MLRAISLYLPNWPVYLLRRRDRARASRTGTPARQDEPVILTQSIGPRPLVAACCPRARKIGIAPGMTVADARALVRSGALRIEPFEPAHDDAALHALARWATRFTPAVAASPPGGLLLNVTGCMRLFGGEARLMRRVAREVNTLGLSWRLAMAPTYGAAWAIARYGPECAMNVGADSLRATLEPMPLASLRIDPATVAALEEVGIETVADLLALPRATLPSRFGSELLTRLDQAMGLVPETIEPVRPREPTRTERVLEGPTTSLEVLGIVVRGLLESLAHELALGGRGVRRLDATFGRTDLGPLTVNVPLGRASRDAGHLWSLLRPRMEKMQMGFGIDRVELLAARTGRVRETQASNWGTGNEEPDSRAFDEMCDAVANRIGPGRVLEARAVDSHIPERSFMYIPAADTGAPGPRQDRYADEATARGGDRPSLLFRSPEPARVIAGPDDGPPWRIAWSGGECAIASNIGPERLASAWWAHASGPRPTDPCARDYFKVQDTRGRWLWVFRESGRWFVHGVWA